MANKLTDSYVKRYVNSCREEAYQSKTSRMALNRDNYDMYHLRHDFSHKKDGQSTEILSKQKMAVEQIKSFFQQALCDLGEWWRAVPADGSSGELMLIRPEEIQKLTNHMLQKANYFSHVGNSVQSALLGSLAVTKVHGCMESKPKYKVRSEGRGKSFKKYVEAVEDKTWQLALDIIRQENYFPDPTAEKGRYRIEECYLDLTTVRQLSEEPYAIFDKEVVKNLQPWTGGDSLQEMKKSREQGQNTVVGSMRPRVKLTEFWGDIVDDKTGEVLFENCVVTIANDTHIIRKPTQNPLWHQRAPIIAAPLLEVANSVWHTALMDAATKHNRSLIEIFNLVLDAAMMQVHGIKQLRTDVLADPKQVSDGIRAGDTLQVTSALPAGAKVLEPLIAVEIPAQAMNVMNVLSQEFNASALTNDLRQGVMPFRAVKATEVVEASNTITSVFQGLAKNVEAKLIQPELELSWMTIAQNWDLIDREVFISLFGKERGEFLSQIDPQDVFVNTVNGVRFEVYGITLTLGKTQDFRKLTTLLQTIGSSEVLIEEFTKRYDFGKLLGEIMTSLDLNKKKLEVDQATQALSQGGGGDPLAQAGAPGAPNQMSQVPQAGAGSLADIFQQPNFPGSPALAGRGG
jgi:hypothetical protein